MLNVSARTCAWDEEELGGGGGGQGAGDTGIFPGTPCVWYRETAEWGSLSCHDQSGEVPSLPNGETRERGKEMITFIKKKSEF